MARIMKDSGIEWIGQIPESWEMIRVKNIFTYHKDIVGDKEDEYERLSLTLKGVLKRPKNDNKGLQSESFSTYQILNEKELVFKMIDLENVSTSRVGYSPFTGIVSPVYIILNNEKYTKFGYYYFYNMWQRTIFNQMGNNGVRSSLNASDMLNIPFPNISEDEANKIAEFLDDKVKEIDAIIIKTKESIDEYKKYKQSVVTEAITQGLNKDVLIKDTDNVYTSKIPVHWQMKRIKYIFEIKKDIAGKEGYDILSITQKGIKVKDISKNEGQVAQNYSNYQLVDIGDFAMNHMDLLTGWVDISQYAGVTSPDYRVFRFIDATGYDADYYLYLMQMCYMNRIFYGLGQGVSNLGRWRLQADKFLNFTIPEPPLEEQQEIAKCLSAKCTEIDALIAKKEAFVEEMETYKKSLVYEYVTGKKEVI